MCDLHKFQITITRKDCMHVKIGISASGIEFYAAAGVIELFKFFLLCILCKHLHSHTGSILVLLEKFQKSCTQTHIVNSKHDIHRACSYKMYLHFYNFQHRSRSKFDFLQHHRWIFFTYSESPLPILFSIFLHIIIIPQAIQCSAVRGRD
jgi:hypothetical protein